MKPLNATTRKLCWIFINRNILAIHLTNYIDFNNSLHHVISFDGPNHNWNSITVYLTLSINGPNLSTFLQIVLALIQECDQICPLLFKSQSPIQEYNWNSPPMSRWWSPLFKVYDRILVSSMNDCPYPKVW
jgi:hypothetical protein